jgi:transposase
MLVSSPTTSGEQAPYAALGLSKNSWLLAIQLPDRDKPSLNPITGGDAEGLIAKLDAARQRLAKASGQVPKLTLFYEAAYDGFWLTRFLELRGVGCRVMDPASLQVDLRGFGARRRGRPMVGSVRVD